MCVGMGMIFTSCSNDDKEMGGPDTDGSKGETGYFSFTTSTNPKALSTKATVEAGDPVESIVTSGFVALYEDLGNSAPGELKYWFPLTISNDDGVGGLTNFNGSSVSTNAILSNTEDRFTMVAEKIKVDNYLMLVVLNPTSDINGATAVGKDYTDFATAEKSVTPIDYASNVSTDDDPLYSKITMSNGRGLVPVAKAQFYETAKEAEQAVNIPTVGVDRIVSKVRFTRSTTMNMPKNGTFGKATWALDITNKSTFWMRKQAKIAPYAGGGDETFVTDRDYLYAMDANWTGFSYRLPEAITNAQITAKDLDDEFNYIQLLPTPDNAIKNVLLPTAGDYTREYVLENTMEAAEQYEDVTTRILIRGNYIPEGFASEASYYFFRGYAFTHQQIVDMKKNDLWPDLPSGLKEAVTTSNFDFTLGSTEPSNSVTDNNNLITFYKNGYSYYRILVRHFNDTLSPDKMGYGRYGIVRNNVYDVTLTRVDGPGKPTIPKPEGPDDKEDQYISAEIHVQPWVVRTQNAEI